jgi:serine/threonine protein kinase
MTIYCPNYYCHLPQQAAKFCSTCNTPLDINGSVNGQAITYQLTKVLQDSGGKIKDDGQYCWYELFQAQANGANFVIKMLIIVPDRLSPSNANHISKVKKRFQREYNLLCKGLEGVCKAYEILDIPIGTEMVQSIVMEEISGLNLEEYLAQNRAIDSQRALRWIKQLLITISNMHKNQVQHRDIKPSNIIITGKSPNEQLILIDFGIALDRSGLTDDTTGTDMMGTPDYLDPVYRDSGEYLNNSDFYSLGQTFIKLLVGKLPEDKDNWDKDYHIAHPPINPKLRNALWRMVALDKAKRFKTAEKILQYLENRYLPKWLKILALTISGLIVSLLIYRFVHPPVISPSLIYVHPICEISEINCGTRIPDDDTNPGIQSAFKKLSKPDDKNKEEAIKDYEKKWKEYQGKDQGPELLIDLNNAKVQASINSSQKIFVLLVAVPKYSKESKISTSLLSGVAQVQKEYNNPNNKNTKLYIAVLKEPREDDAHTQLREIINKVIKATEDENSSAFKSKFIGVIGHYSSQVTFSVLDVYARNEVLLISPASSLSDIPKSKEKLKQLDYFARTINSTKGQAYEIASWLRRLASKSENCGMINIHLVYQEDDVASMALNIELKSLFSMSSNSIIENVEIEDLPYTLGSFSVAEVEKKILSSIENSLRLGEQKTAKKYLQTNCKPRQIVAFFPGPHVKASQRQITIHVANNIPENVDFMGNISSSIISDTNIQSEINNNFYSRAYVVNPYNILDFIQSKERKLDLELMESMMSDNKQPDISSIDWRQISSADATRVFTRAITEYVNRENEFKDKKIPRIFHDIIKGEQFVSNGFSGEVRFDGYERKGAKTGTILKYIRRCDTGNYAGLNCSSKEMVAVPIGYRDPRSPKKEAESYKALTPKDLVSIESKSLEVENK